MRYPHIIFQSSQTTCWECLACHIHDAKEAYELSVTLREEVTVLRKMEGKLVKATSQQTHDTGYVPFQCLCEK